MSSKNTEIQAAIDSFDVTRARELLRDALKEADGETYYLASRVALDDQQRKSFLEKAVQADPFHEKARQELNTSKSPVSPSYSSAPTSGVTANPVTSSFSANQTYTEIDQSQLADTGQRFVAYIIDGIILGIVGFVIGLIVRYPDINFYNSYSQYYSAMNQWYGTILIATVICQAAYYAYFLTQNEGQTPGKRAMKIRIVKINGQPLTIGDAIVRNVIGYILSSLFIMLGFIWATFDKNRQGWHDKLASTLVIKA